MTIGLSTAFLSGLILFNVLAGLGFVLLIVLAIVAFIWRFFINDKYQNWLTRCYYGTGPNKFQNMIEQQTAFQRVTSDSAPDKETEADDEDATAPTLLYQGYRQIPGVA